MGPVTSMADTTHLIPIHYGKEDYLGSTNYRCTEFLQEGFNSSSSETSTRALYRVTHTNRWVLLSFRI